MRLGIHMPLKDGDFLVDFNTQGCGSRIGYLQKRDDGRYDVRMGHKSIGIAPKPENWPVLVTKMGDLLRKDYDWSKEVAAIKAPTMLVYGDADSIHPEYAVEFFKLLGGGKKDGGWDNSGISNARLAILPGVTHYNIFTAPALLPAVTPFLDAPMPVAK